MMKRMVALCLAALMLTALLAACGDNGKQDETDAAKVKSVSLTELLSTINAEMGISESTIEGLNIITTESELFRKYGVHEKLIKQFAAERTSSKNDYMELVMIEAIDEDAVTQIVNQLNSRLDAQRNTAKSYNPEAVELLENCKITTNGNFIYLVISEKQKEIEKMIEEALQ